MNGVCAYVLIKTHFWGLQGFHCRMYSTKKASLRLVRELAGRGLKDLEPDGLVNMEDIPVLPA